MIRVCCQCRSRLGEAAPFDDRRETHGYCDACLLAVYADTFGADALELPGVVTLIESATTGLSLRNW